jgi:putative addiction module CopG family antidote
VNIHISEESRRFVTGEVASGRYASEEAVVEDALRQMREQSPPPVTTNELENLPFWGMFRDEPELIDQIVEQAMRERLTTPLRAREHE